MYYNIIKSIENRKKYCSLYNTNWFTRLIYENHFFSYDIYEYNLRKNNSMVCKLRIRCMINGRSRSVNSKFRLSRFFFKEFSRKGLINGIVKF